MAPGPATNCTVQLYIIMDYLPASGRKLKLKSRQQAGRQAGQQDGSARGAGLFMQNCTAPSALDFREPHNPIRKSEKRKQKKCQATVMHMTSTAESCSRIFD